MDSYEKQLILHKFDKFLLEKSFGSCRPRDRNIAIPNALDGLEEILNSLPETKWNDVSLVPETDRNLIVMDSNESEFDNHMWNGLRYYEFIEDEDGSADGYPSDRDIKFWRYDE